MKLGVTDDYLCRYGVDDGLRRMKAQGYECLDYNMADTESGFYLVDEDKLEAEVAAFRKKVEDAGIIINQVHGPWRWPPRDFTDEDRTERFEKMAKCIKVTKMLGCRNFVIHPIMPFGDNQDPDPAKLWEMNLEFFRRLLPIAVENDVIICYENMPMLALSNSTPEAILRFAKEMNSPNFKVCLDTGHCAVFGIQPAEAVRLLGKDYLQVLHMHDNNGHGDQHLTPFKGVIDWMDFGKALNEIGFEGCASLECFVPHSTPKEQWDEAEAALFNDLCRIAGR